MIIIREYYREYGTRGEREKRGIKGESTNNFNHKFSF